jgi:DNA-binding protein H-NS
MNMELNKLSLSELKRQKTRIEAEIARRSLNSKRDLLKKVQKMAAEAGVPLSELLGTKKESVAAKTPKASKATAKKTRGSKGKVAPKYRNPADAAQTWTGRGRQPLWVSGYTATGKPITDLLIK